MKQADRTILGLRATLRGLASAASVATALLAGSASAQSEEGKDIFRDANCIGCHKWHGAGGGGYGGAALSLRETVLSREELIDVIRCGRPATGMPYHARRAWTEADPCFGSTKEEMGDLTPPRAANFLRDPQIEAVADYVVSHQKGQGAPTREECIAFWGPGSRECERF